MTSLPKKPASPAGDFADLDAAFPSRRRSRRLLLAGIVIALVIVAGIVFAATRRPPAPPPVAVAPATAVSLTEARGRVVPSREARVASLTGGVVLDLPISVGNLVRQQEAIARVRGPNGLELLTAPWTGTVTDIAVQQGDSLSPGLRVATVADLDSLLVETDDVDEFIVSDIHAGQAVTLTLDALDGVNVWGQVLTVAPAPSTTPAGDQHYPVRIALWEPDAAIRPGMTVRVTFLPDD